MSSTDFQRPKRLEVERETLTATFGRFFAQPFERGFGTTLGNALRRCLLSSIEGAAICAVEIEGVAHEFSSIAGISEDVTDIILNLKQIPIRLHSSSPRVLSLDLSGPRQVVSGDLAGDPQVEICNPDLPIATINEDGRLRMQVQVRRGRGYVPAEKLSSEELGATWIAVDAIFSPIRRANFRVEPARVGRVTDYERLILEVWTNGAVTPEEGVAQAAELLAEHLGIFMAAPEAVRGDSSAALDEELETTLSRSLDEFELSVRTANCLKNANIHTLRDLVVRSERDLLEIKNFGKKSFEELQELLQRLGLSLGMELPVIGRAGLRS
jgi:DNA-directed RNA polymerase subunit alpha